MSLRFVFGRSGTGKSEFIFNEIRDSDFDKIFIIVPEQFSFSAETSLINSVGTGSVIKAEVLTLSRMAERVIFETVGGQKSNLSKIGRNMIIYNILDNNKNNLKFLGNPDKNLDVVSRTITEFKKHSITPEVIDSIETKIDNNEYLKLKLDEIKNILELYRDKINRDYLDESDSLTLLAQNLSKTDMFDNSIIYIDEFSGFTTQEYDIIEELLKKAKQVTVNICSDDLENCEEGELFYFNKITASKLIKRAKNANCKIEKPVFCMDNKRNSSKELRFLEENLYGNNVYKDDVNDIKIFLAKSPYSETQHVAKEILKLVKDGGYRFRDIAVVVNNMENYNQDVNVIFGKYGIPVFIDEKKDINQNIFMKFVVGLMNILSTNFSNDAVFSYLKLGLLDIPEDDIYELENYCGKWGIRYSKWYKSDFSYEPINDKQEKLNEIRKKVIEPILKFKSELSKEKTGKEITYCLYSFLEENRIQEKIIEKAERLEKEGKIELSKEYKASITLFWNVLDEIVKAFENDKMSFEKYMKIMQVGLSESEFGKIPSTVDQVLFGNLDRSKTHNIKALFVLGMNDGVIPSKALDEGFLNDSDREILKQADVEVAKTTIEQLYENQFLIYKTFSMPENKIYFSYPVSDKEGKAVRKSILITRLKKIFPKVIEESDVIESDFEITNKKATLDEAIIEYKKSLEKNESNSEIEDILSWYYFNDNSRLERILAALNYSNKAKNIDEKNIIRLYGKKLKTSVSRLEQYQKCPFSFHLKYGLKLKEKEEFKIRSIDTGNFMHDVIDSFFKRIDDDCLDIKTISFDDIKEIVYEIIEEKLNMGKNYIFTSSQKFNLMTKQLKEVVLESIYYIVEQLKFSKFKVLGHELEFKEGSDFKPIYMDLDDGKSVEIIGKIDRVDIAEGEDGKLIRIIDYKSSVKDIDLNQVVSGIQIQLLTYMDALTDNDIADPAGVLYFNLINSVVKSDKNLTDDEIKAEIKKMFKMKGLIVADIDIVKMMDQNIKNGSFSEYLPVYLDKEGNISESRSSVLKKEKFEKLQKYIKRLIKDISNEILKGKIDIKPYYLNKKKPCDYCEYKSICNFDINMPGNSYNYINPGKVNKVLDEIFE
ncbi:MAG: helicase-exonuclease AddAB subunit AddB [Clostridia bacterium]|nr:helicase-exonuclease AddAB subunit AddB [Clostridia bacterium]